MSKEICGHHVSVRSRESNPTTLSSLLMQLKGDKAHAEQMRQATRGGTFHSPVNVCDGHRGPRSSFFLL